MGKTGKLWKHSILPFGPCHKPQVLIITWLHYEEMSPMKPQGLGGREIC
jgi:hypothetical protein